MDMKNVSKKRDKQLQVIKLLCMAAASLFFCQSGIRVQAAETGKKPPLVNLAEEKQVQVTVGADMTLANPEKLTDGDKYNLQHDKTVNKDNGKWEKYIEDGAVTTVTGQSGQPVYIQMDLGAPYPIEVINLKRRVYQGTPGDNGNQQNCRVTGNKYTYQDTAIVVGNEPDLSDGTVVYYSGNVALPEGVAKPSDVSNAYQEAMGGQWFYMDYSKGKGLGATPLGTVKTARYVRVYSKNPQAGKNNVDFMELAVYGYEEERSVQKTTGLRRQIDNEHPLMIATAYSNDVYEIGQEKGPDLQGWNTVGGRWDAIPDDLKPYNVMLLHTNNLRQFSPDHISQAYLQEFHEHGLQIAYEKNEPIMLLAITASAVPGGSQYNVTRDMDLGWLDLMFRMYPNMEGLFNTENFWSGSFGQVATATAKMLEIADRFGGYFVWSEHESGNIISSIKGNSTLMDALNKYSDHYYMIYKNTAGSNDDLRTSSYFQGSWLAGYTGGWGMLSDTWAWEKKYAKLWQNGGNYNNWQKLCGEPESLLGMQMMSTYLGGGVIYTFEFPEIVYGTADTNSPAYTHVLSDLMRYIIKNPAPSKAELLEETKTVVYGNVSNDFYQGLAGNPTAFSIYETGRYGLMPVIPAWESREAATARLSKIAGELGVAMPNVIASTDANVQAASKVQYFRQYYPIEYVGDAFADKQKGKWYLYNSMVNTNKKQSAVLPLEGPEESARLKVEMEPHAFLMMDEAGDGTSIDIRLNNYRVNKDSYVFDNKFNLTWTGNFAPGQPVIEGKNSVYTYMRDYNVVNAPAGKYSPDDNVLRTTTFELTKLAKKPTVTLVAGQAADTDGQPQYQQPQVIFEEGTGKATITIQTNGWVDLRFSDLEFVYDENAVQITDEPVHAEAKNLALRQPVSAHNNSFSPNRQQHATNGTISESDYSDPGGNAGGPQWLQVDLGGIHNVEKVRLVRYYSDTRQYKDTVVMLSEDSQFAPDKTLVLWNSNKQDTAVWPGGFPAIDVTGSGDTAKHRLPTGNEALYTEIQAGQEMTVTDSRVTWLDGDTTRPKPQDGESFPARYVRVYMNGSSVGTSNHVVEMEVYGTQGEIVLTDTEAPTTPGDIKVTPLSFTEAKLVFLPSADNMGLKHYEMILKKDGTEIKRRELQQTQLELTELEEGGNYTVEITAVDTSDLRSQTASASFQMPVRIVVQGNIPSGIYDSGQSVTLTASEGEIYYTLDGSAPLQAGGKPTAAALAYSGPIAVDSNLVLRAAVSKDGISHPSVSWYYIIGEQSDTMAAPAAPGAVSVESYAAVSAKIQWAAAEAGNSYRLYVNGEKKWEGTEMEVTLTGLTPLTAYRVYVTAVDEGGNESLRSETIEFITRKE